MRTKSNLLTDYNVTISYFILDTSPSVSVETVSTGATSVGRMYL